MADQAEKPPIVPLLLTYEQAAPLLTVKVSTLRRLVSRGEIRPVRIGRCVRFTEQILADFIERASKPATLQGRRKTKAQ